MAEAVPARTGGQETLLLTRRLSVYGTPASNPVATAGLAKVARDRIERTLEDMHVLLAQYGLRVTWE